jgi:redox-sensitive bicupin YhaK (pirin superfamily)
MQIIEPRLVKLSTRTEVEVRRNIPHAKLNRVGAWVFLDHFGPTPQVEGMQVAAHPHTGLQTVTWLFEGAVDHHDTIGSAQTIHPGQLNLMTSGTGIAHSEKSVAGPASLHAVQLWLALPNAVRGVAPDFQHVPDAPKILMDALHAKVFIGELAGIESAAKVYSPLVGAELRLTGTSTLPLNTGWEHAILVVAGTLEINGDQVAADQLAFLPAGARNVRLEGQNFLGILIGGAPFDEKIVMWWNFIGRSNEEIVEMRESWNARRYPAVSDDLGGWIPAPELPNVTLKAR